MSSVSNLKISNTLIKEDSSIENLENYTDMTLEQKQIYIKNLFDDYYKAQINYMNKLTLKKLLK